MNLLLLVVEATGASRSLSIAAAQSHHSPDDCSDIVEFCGKALPAALSAIDELDADDEQRAAECVQALTATMQQTQSALLAISEFDELGVLQLLLEHPSCWLDLYRGMRGLMAHLTALSSLLSSARPRRATEAEEALQASLRAFTAVCARARDAANLIGSDLPDFARSVAASGWSSERLRAALAPATTAALCDSHSSCDGGSDAPAPASPPASSAARGSWGLMRLLSRASGGAATGRASGEALSPAGVISPACSATTSRCSSLEALVVRIQEAILYDNELDQLDQDRAYLLDRVTHLRVHHDSTAAQCAAAGSPGSEAQLAAAAALVQSQVLLAAVDARLAVVRELEGSGHPAGGLRAGALASSWRCPAACAQGQQGQQRQQQAEAKGHKQQQAPARPRADVVRLVDPDDLYDDVRKRKSPRWLPVCFVGA